MYYAYTGTLTGSSRLETLSINQIQREWSGREWLEEQGATSSPWSIQSTFVVQAETQRRLNTLLKLNLAEISLEVIQAAAYIEPLDNYIVFFKDVDKNKVVFLGTKSIHVKINSQNAWRILSIGTAKLLELKII